MHENSHKSKSPVDNTSSLHKVVFNVKKAIRVEYIEGEGTELPEGRKL